MEGCGLALWHIASSVWGWVMEDYLEQEDAGNQVYFTLIGSLNL